MSQEIPHEEPIEEENEPENEEQVDYSSLGHDLGEEVAQLVEEPDEPVETDEYTTLGHTLGKTISEKYEELAQHNKEKEYAEKVQQLVGAGYTLQEARDKVDFDETYAGILKPVIKGEKTYEEKVQQLVDAGYTLQEARDKVDFDETYAGVLDKLNEEVFGEEDDVELPTVQITPEPEEVVNLYSRTEERVLTRDGSIWDGTQNTTVGTVTYNGDKREVHPLEVSPIMNSSYEIIGLLQPGDSFNALGWVKHVKYKNDKRYWVDTFGHRIPVHATSEKPV